jgi:hypothetical protein
VSKLIFGRDIRMQMVRAIPDVTCGSLRVGRSPKRYRKSPQRTAAQSVADPIAIARSILVSPQGVEGAALWS